VSRASLRVRLKVTVQGPLCGQPTGLVTVPSSLPSWPSPPIDIKSCWSCCNLQAVIEQAAQHRVVTFFKKPRRCIMCAAATLCPECRWCVRPATPGCQELTTMCLFFICCRQSMEQRGRGPGGGCVRSRPVHVQRRMGPACQWGQHTGGVLPSLDVSVGQTALCARGDGMGAG
jgi:hypothetical protein